MSNPSVEFSSLEDELELVKSKLKRMLLEFKQKTGLIITGVQPFYMDIEEENGTVSFILDSVSICFEKNFKEGG